MMTGGVSDRIQELGWLSLTRGEGGQLCGVRLDERIIEID